MSIDIGSAAPGFDLTDGRGDRWGPVGGSATVIVFTSASCPYARAWHDRLQAVAHDYAPQGVRVGFVGVEDPDGAAVATTYGATVTPEVFLLDGDGKLRYRGAPDADHEDERQGARWLRNALDTVLAGEPVVEAITQPVGCAIAG
ncbi:MAG: hypothetical protein ACJ762_17675 [Solirubrobacteraceae bacterium]